MEHIEELLQHLRDELAPLQGLREDLEQVKASICLLLQERVTRAWYTPSELAILLGKSDYTVREWCRLGRIHAQKLPHGRGNEGEWRIAQEEVDRYREQGLLPLTRKH